MGDGLFEVFLVALTGQWSVEPMEPYRAVFFTFSSYEQKMRIVDSAMKARYRENNEILEEWKAFRKSLNDFSKLRNEIAHLVPAWEGFSDPDTKANVRLIPAFWKRLPSYSSLEFNNGIGYSFDELEQTLAPFWGYHPTRWRPGEPTKQIAFRLRQFTLKLVSSQKPLQAPPANR
jgi:hypothetical protein